MNAKEVIKDTEIKMKKTLEMEKVMQLFEKD